MKKACIFLAEGFEEIEALTTVDLLRRSIIEVSIVSVTSELKVRGAHGITVIADELFDETKCFEKDAVILPGGVPGTPNLKEHNGVENVLKYFFENKKIIAAICAAPSIIGNLGMLKEKHAVCYPGYENELTGAYLSKDLFVQDKNILTSKSAGTAIPFSLQLIEMLTDKQTADEVKNKIVY